MRKEVVLKRKNGSRVRIVTEYFTERYIRGGGCYRTSVFTCEKGKRTWKPSFNCDCYKYRRLNMDDRRDYEYQSQFDHITEEELLAAKMSLWEDMKPE